MQKRYPLAALAALSLVGAAGPAYAAPADEPTTEAAASPEVAATQLITLPTGDQVRLTADGSYVTEPLEDETAFHTSVEPDGDRLVIPAEALPQIADGEFSMEQFNIDALTRQGIADAGDPDAAALLEAEAAPQVGAQQRVEVDFTALWSDGSAPEVTYLRWLNLDTGAGNSTVFGDGTNTIDLSAGHVQMIVTLDEFEPTRSLIFGIIDLHIEPGEEPILFDGAAATPVGFALDRETVEEESILTAFSFLPGTTEGLQNGLRNYGDREVAVVPTDWDTTGRDVGFTLNQEYTSPKNAKEPYSYSLWDMHSDGIPADPVFRVSDAELARIEMDYDSLGVETEMRRQNLAVHPLYEAFGYLHSGFVDVPSHRTEFYSAGPDLEWSHAGTFGDVAIEEYADVLHYSGSLEPGSVGEIGWNQGPVTVGVDIAGVDYYLPRVYRWEESGWLLTNPSMFSSGSPDEAVISFRTPGQTALSRNGMGINKSEVGGELETYLDYVPEGRYELHSEAYRDVPWTPLGTASTADWSFATAPSTEDAFIAVSVVDFNVEGIENGYADAATTQQVDLEYATQPGAEPQVCTAMTFEVSYDDGQTWEPVAIDRNGNHATAELTHPDGAEFVSIRFTAADEAGNTVTHSTIRSYGLR